MFPLYPKIPSLKDSTEPKVTSYDTFESLKADGWDTSGVNKLGAHGACTVWSAFKSGRQSGGSKATRVMKGAGKAILDLEDCYTDTGSTVWYDGQQIGPTVNGKGPTKRHKFEFDFEDGKVLEVREVHSIWKVHSLSVAQLEKKVKNIIFLKFSIIIFGNINAISQCYYAEQAIIHKNA